MLPTQAKFAPEWVKDAIFYQIFPERFANGDRSNDPPGVERWGAPPKGNNYFGGDLQGIIDHLDYVSDLGANAIYLNPVFSSSSNHKYFTSDYLTIDPAFGTNALFGKLVNECHERKIRIVIDGVFNHTGVEHWAFQDIVKNGAASKYAAWYNIYSYPIALPPRKPNYECWWNYGRLPKLMAQNPDVKAHLFEVTKYWTAIGIDGWRLDVPNEIPHEFWIEWRKLVKSINPECYIVGEIWNDATPWLRGDQFDAVMNYPFRDAILDYFCHEKTSPTEFDQRLSHVRSLYSDEVNYAMQNLIGSHDTERFLTLCKRDVSKENLALLFQMTYIGAPMTYYGDEIGMEGGRDPDCRRTMIWDQKKWNKKLRGYYKKLVAVRNSSNALRRGDFTTLVADNRRNLFAFRRSLGHERVYVAINRDNKSRQIELPIGDKAEECKDALTHERLSARDGYLRFTVAGRSGKIIIGTT